MNGTHASWKRYVAAIGGGLVAVTLVGLLHYQWQIEARKGVLMLYQGQRLGGAAAMGNGLFGSIVGAMLVGAVVLVAVLVAQWATLDIRAGLAMTVLCMIPLSFFNAGVARHLIQHPLPVAGAAPAGSSLWSILVPTFNSTLLPAVAGLVIGYVINFKTRDRIEREANGIVFEARPERVEPGVADPGIWQAASGSPRDDRTDSRPADADATALETESHAQPEQRPDQPVERRAITCRECGASNVPLRANCLRCGAALA